MTAKQAVGSQAPDGSTYVTLTDGAGTLGAGVTVTVGDGTGPLTVDGSGSAGTAAAGVLSVQGITSMTPIQIGDNAGSITVDNAGTFVTQPTLQAGSALAGRMVADASAATGGIASTTRLLSAAGTSGDATNVKASAGRLYAIQGANVRTSAVYLKLYNSATAPTAGSGTPVKTLYIPASSAFAFDWHLGYSFSAGIGFTLVTGSADNSSTSVTAGDILALNIDYV